MIIHKCDKCGKLHEQKPGERSSIPPEWQRIMGGGYGTQWSYEVGPGCRKALRIPDTAADTDIGERLVEILSEMVEEAVENHTGP